MNFFPESIADNSFIEKNYDISAKEGISFPDGKNNLVCILVESLEDSFEEYIPNLDQLREEGLSFPNMLMAHGTNWTIAAQTAWSFGLPLKTPVGIERNHYISKDGFLPNALSIFDILAQNGYKCVLIMGTDASFGATELLFDQHGKFEVRDKKYFLEKGYDLALNQGTEWGFSDKFVLEQAFEAYKQLLRQNGPFVLFVSTMDTHSPDGYAPPDARQFGDIRDAILEADRNVSCYVRKILAIKEGHDRLALCVLGDHEYMGMPDFLKGKERRIYNFFTGKIAHMASPGLDSAFSALDIAPTLLQMAGARWKNARFGLGVSIFSDTPSLMEKIGQKNLNEELAARSKFYEKFY